jgi:hypothetical protein
VNLKARLERLEQAITEQRSGMSEGEPDCICYPATGFYSLSAEEYQAAEALQCPLHGKRVPESAMFTYRAHWRKRLDPQSDPDCRDPQFLKATLATRAYLEGNK